MYSFMRDSLQAQTTLTSKLKVYHKNKDDDIHSEAFEKKVNE